MGTHPIFESDFDCLTELVWVEIGATDKTDFDARREQREPDNRLVNALHLVYLVWFPTPHFEIKKKRLYIKLTASKNREASKTKQVSRDLTWSNFWLYYYVQLRHLTQVFALS